MVTKRTLSRVITLPQPIVGQFGPDHRVIEVFRPSDWADADPFILLNDDRIHGYFRGSAHPHIGMETVTYLIEGSLGQENSDGQLYPGDVEWTTTGKGVVHGGHVGAGVLNFRLMQLWVTLPKSERWAEPDHQFVPKDEALLRQENNAILHLYSGTSGELRSDTRNHVPVTFAAIELEPGARILQNAPSSHNGFFYPLAGRIQAGGVDVQVGQVGWLDKPQSNDDAVIEIANLSDQAATTLFYTGERQNTPIVTYGPFVGDSREDINRAFHDYEAGLFIEY